MIVYDTFMPFFCFLLIILACSLSPAPSRSSAPKQHFWMYNTHLIMEHYEPEQHLDAHQHDAYVVIISFVL